MIVTLSFFELHQAAAVGAMRNIQARRKARADSHGMGADGWGVHIEGAAAEMAVAKLTGKYYEGVWEAIDRSKPDVGNFHVRSTMRENGCLLLHKTDPDGIYVLVVGLAPIFDIIGWTRGSEGKVDKYWRTDTGRPAYFVPQSALKDPLWLNPENMRAGS